MRGDKYFALDLRRTLYFAQIMQHQCDWTKAGTTHSGIRTALNNVVNANKRLLLEVATVAKDPETYATIKQDLSEDYVHDLAILIDELFEVKDLSGIITAIQNVKKQWKDDATNRAEN